MNFNSSRKLTVGTYPAVPEVDRHADVKGILAVVLEVTILYHALKSET